MMEFNPDGSIKLPEQYARAKQEKEQRMRDQRCLRIRKEQVSFTPPKSCALSITLSDRISDPRFIETIFSYFNRRDKVPMKLEQLGEKEFSITIGTSFLRCTECCTIVREFREHMEGCLIEEKGSCTFEDRKKDFFYEDYFD